MIVPTTMRGLPARCGFLFAALFCGAWWASSVAARSIEIDDFLVEVAVDASGGLDVTETLRLRFSGQWNGIIRTIPLQNVTTSGVRRSLGFRLVSVADEAGRPLEVTKSRHGADLNLRIRVPGAADAVRTVVIRYRITGGLRFFDDHDELYWNLTGDEWTFPIRAARARITLPRDLVNVRVNAFTGPHGSRERAVRIRVDGAEQGPDDAFLPVGESPPAPQGDVRVIEIEATRPLGIREGLTAAVAWNPGVVERPSALARMINAWSSWLAGRTVALALFGVPLLAFVGMLWRWWLVGRDPRPGPLVVEYGPPDGLGPAEAGTLIDNKPDNRDLVAGLVDAAVKGVVRIRETSPKGWFTRPEYAFDLLVPESLPASRWIAAGVSLAGCRLLRAMFPGADGDPLPSGAIQTVTSADLDNSFHVNVPGIKDVIFADLIGRGLYVGRPDTTVTRYSILAVVCGGLTWLLGAYAMGWRPGPVDPATMAVPFITGVATLFVIALFAVVMPARTVAGARARDRVRGFQEFLARVEAHRLESLPMTPELFEKFLPYAMALGVERRWAHAFADICTRPPDWYVGSASDDLFDTDGFTDRLGAMTTATAAVMTSSPRSSGDSGFGGGDGGGSSGGGDGGGGGSGW